MALFFFDCGPCNVGATPSYDIRVLETVVFRGFYYPGDSDLEDRLAEAVDAAITGLIDIGPITDVSWNYRTRGQRYWSDSTFTTSTNAITGPDLSTVEAFHYSAASRFGASAQGVAQIAQIRFNGPGKLTVKDYTILYDEVPGLGRPLISTTSTNYTTGDIVTVSIAPRYGWNSGAPGGVATGPNVCP